MLELELPEQDISERRAKELREYTQVIIKEADRLQVLVDRLLAPNRLPQVIADVNIHEVCERVRSLILAEFPKGTLVSNAIMIYRSRSSVGSAAVDSGGFEYCS